MTKLQNSKIKITEPITEEDFKRASELVEKNIVADTNLSVQYLKKLSVGEIMVAKDEDKVIGMICQKRPGKIFLEFPDKQFNLKKYKFAKKDIGFIILIAVDPKYQGQGIGKKLVTMALKYQKDFGAKAVGVHAWQSSPGNGSQKLFESFGFTHLKMHKSPWLKYSKKAGPKGYWCPVCGNPCKCDELEMVKYL
jgi:ribosomal protein S18 acetylase RimI-like enzyme